MGDNEPEIDKVAFDSADKPDRGFTVRASYLKEPHKGDALIEIFRDGKPLRRFLYPAYRIFNIAAHFSDIVDGELSGHDGGYRMANWNGLTPTGPAEPIKP